MKRRQMDNASLDSLSLATLTALPRPVYGHHLALPNRAISQMHTHAWAQLSYAVRGVIEVRTASGWFTAPPLRAVWVPAYTEHGVWCSGDAEIRSLYLDVATLGKVAPETQVWTRCRVISVEPLLRELIRCFAKLPVNYDEEGADGRLVRVLIDQLVAAPEAALMVLPWPEDPRLQKVCTGLQKNPENSKTLAQYSNKVEVSEKTLSRLFKQQTGLSFRLWRQRSRLFKALPMLERGERVTDVALACGYDSLSAFIVAFRRQTGVTPGEFFNRQ